MRPKVAALVSVTVAIAMTLGFMARAQRRGERGQNRVPENSELLQSVKRLKCVFPGKPLDPSVTIDRIDTDEGTAELDTFFRRGETGVNVKLAGSNLHFLNVGIDGGLIVVTVFAKETHDHRLQAVYSRAAYPDAAQYVGDCEATR
jgi:hypothetical protein